MACRAAAWNTNIAATCIARRRYDRPTLEYAFMPLADDSHVASTTSEGTTVQSPKETEEVPLWVRRDEEKKLQQASTEKDLPFGLLLLFSCFTAIAAIGSVFEYTNQNPIFGQIGPDSPLYTPILGFFAITGLPTAGWLFFKSVESANRAAERMDKVDGL